MRTLETRLDQLRLGRTIAMCDLKLVEAYLKTAESKIMVLEVEVAISKSLADSIKEKWERS